MTPDPLPIEPCGPLLASVRPPGSKSLTNRALVCAALATDESRLSGALVSEDTGVMIESLSRLGIAIERRGGEIRIQGCGGEIPAAGADMFVANSGTTIRFLTAVAALGRGVFRLDGIQRMRERPIGDLVRGLAQLGVEIEAARGFPPVTIRAAGLPGGRVTLRGDVSSQFLSGLLLAAPRAASDVTIEIDGPLVSAPYVEMTLSVMEQFGRRVEQAAGRVFHVPAPQHYRGRQLEIEPDATAASYFWAAAAVAGGTVLVEGLTRDSLQGDIAFCRRLAAMGCRVEDRPNGIAVTGGALSGIETDMNDISDTVQTLAVVALFADGPTTITGVAHNRHKETDRIADLARELRQLGAAVEELSDGIRITPGPLRGAAVETYGDHRMAMSLSLAGLRVPGVAVKNPECVGKTYPDFFADLNRVCNP